MTTTTTPPIPSALYFTDNGAMLCGAHLGSSARYTGCDISGQPIERVTLDDAQYLASLNVPARCEHCGGGSPSLGD